MQNKGIIVGLVIAFVVTVSALIYAAFTQDLNINGNADIRNSSWDVHFVERGTTLNYSYKSETATAVNPNVTDNTIGNYSVTFSTPGDKVVYTFHVVNDGDYDAKLSTLNKTNPVCSVNGDTTNTSAINVCKHLRYTLKYDSENGTAVTQNDTISSKETQTMVLVLEYEEFSEASELPASDVDITGLGIELTYTQDSKAKVNTDGTTPYVDPYSHHIGDRINVAGEYYYVIQNSLTEDDYVVALKENPLTKAEIDNNHYGEGYINKNTYTVHNQNGYGGVVYYSSPTCRSPYVDGVSQSQVESGCASENATSYESSDVKHVVDDWANDKFQNKELKQVDGYKARLIKFQELLLGLGYSWNVTSSNVGINPASNPDVPNWVWNLNFKYWTMSQYNDSVSIVWSVGHDGCIGSDWVYSGYITVRPVINVYKSKIQS